MWNLLYIHLLFTCFAMCMSHIVQVTIQPSLDNTQSPLMRPFGPILLCLVRFKLALRNMSYWIRPVTRIVGLLSSRTSIYNLLLIKIDCKLTYIQPNGKLWLGFILFLFFIFYKQRLGLFNFYLRGILFVGPRSPIVLTSHKLQQNHTFRSNYVWYY